MDNKRIVVLGLGSDVEFICSVLCKIEESNQEIRNKAHSISLLNKLPGDLDYFDVFIIGESMVDKVDFNQLSMDKLIVVVRSIPPKLQDKPIRFVLSNYRSKIKTAEFLDKAVRNTLFKVA